LVIFFINTSHNELLTAVAEIEFLPLFTQYVNIFVVDNTEPNVSNVEFHYSQKIWFCDVMTPLFITPVYYAPSVETIFSMETNLFSNEMKYCANNT
jgi:hypothetical protein